MGKSRVSLELFHWPFVNANYATLVPTKNTLADLNFVHKFQQVTIRFANLRLSTLVVRCSLLFIKYLTLMVQNLSS